jgi:hypothetical protein
MTAPFYNTRSIKIAYVVEGEGHAEIVCPHLSSSGGESERSREQESEKAERREGSSESEEQEEGQGYETVRARLSSGTAFVVPVGHPTVEVASQDGNLQILCFEVQAERNERVYLAGQDSVLQKLDGAAKELAFAASQREVDEVLDAQRDKGFLQGPGEERRQACGGTPRGGSGDAAENGHRQDVRDRSCEVNGDADRALQYAATRQNR